jgi:hypothetical protein
MEKSIIMTANDYIRQNPHILTMPIQPMKFGAEGRKFLCFLHDGRRKGNNKNRGDGMHFPIPVCSTPHYSTLWKQVSVTPDISREITHQVRQVDRREARKRKKARLLHQQYAATQMRKEEYV